MRQSSSPKRYNLETLRSPRLVLVEGPDDFHFIRFLSRRDDLQIHIYEGKTSLQEEIGVLRMVEGFDRLERVVMMRDADDDPQAALQSVLSQWSNAMDEPVPQVRSEEWFADGVGREWLVWIVPNSQDPGDIEELLWRTVKPSPHKDCVEQMIACLGSLSTTPYKSRTKALMYSWLATQSDPVKQLYSALDPKAGFFDPLDPVLRPGADLIDSI